MDEDDDDRDFSKGIVYGFFEQAETTFDSMERALYEALRTTNNNGLTAV